jgi:hypothetical protein
VAADWDSGGSDAGADTIRISETSATAYDVDPDAANYAAGNDPDTAYRNQGRADSPNGWGSQARLDEHQENDDYAEGAGEYDESQEDAHDDALDLWGDTDPDAANYTYLDDIGTGSPNRQQDLYEGQPETDRDPDADVGQPRPDEPAQADADRASPADERTSEPKASQLDQTESAAADTSERPSAEQQRIDALEAERADAKQEVVALKGELAEARQQIADLKAELKAVKDEEATRLEQLPAGTDGYQDGETNTTDHGTDKPHGSRDQDAFLSERIATDQRADTKDDVRAWWRRTASAENVGAVSTLLGAADLAMHGVPGLAVALGATAIGVASWGQAKIEKHRKGKA